jgi:tetratricopeptide (TPR) repeat protein
MFDPEKLLDLGREARAENRLDDARDLLAQAVVEARWLRNQGMQATALKAWGQVERDLKHPDTAVKCYREAAGIYRALGDRLGEAHSIRHVGDIFREQKSAKEAASSYDQALEIYRNHPATPSLDLANTLRGVALLKEAAGADEDALFCWQEACQLYAEAGVDAGVAEAQNNIAFLLGQ